VVRNPSKAWLHDAARAVDIPVDGRSVRVCALRLPATGAAARRRFLLLHGNPSHIDHFAANVDFLRHHGDVALYDAPGFGASPAPTDALSLDFLADVAAAYATSLGWPDGIDVIGQSHGGAVAMTLAARRPTLIRSLILLDSMGYPAHPSMRLAMLPGAAAVDPIPPDFVEEELSWILRTGCSTWFAAYPSR
jgi:pimeloyl-ACP methyl ester carboxylesterase